MEVTKKALSELCFQDFEDQRDPIDLKVTGKFPEFSHGAFYKTGPGSYTVPGSNFKVNHWFDGFTQNHRFEIGGAGKDSKQGTDSKTLISYRSWSPVDDRKEQIKLYGGVDVAKGFADTTPSRTSWRGLFYRCFRGPEITSSYLNTGVSITAGFPSYQTPFKTLVTRTDANQLTIHNPVTLEPLYAHGWNKLDLEGASELRGEMAASHSAIDPVTNEEYNFLLKFGRIPTYTVFKIGPDKKVQIMAVLKEPATYTHSLFLTKRYLIFPLWSLRFWGSGVGIVLKGNLLDAMNETIDESVKTKYIVINRDGSGIKKVVEGPASFALHTINAYEEGDDIILEMSGSKDHSNLYKWSLDYLSSPEANFRESAAVYTRIRLSGDKAILEKAADSQFNLEFPNMNPKFASLKHRYVYGVHSADSSISFHGIIRYDIEQDSSLVWQAPGCVATEPMFVADPKANPSDADHELRGIILVVVMDSVKKHSSLLGLDPRTMKEICRADLPSNRYVGIGFHGSWLDEARAIA